MKYEIVQREKLFSRGCRLISNSNAIEHAQTLDRSVALEKCLMMRVYRIDMTLPTDPRLPRVSSILNRFWKVM